VPEMTVSVTNAVPALNVEEDPDVSHEPEADIDPVVREIEFAAESFIVTPPTTMAAVVPIRLPPPETVRFAPPVMSDPEVVNEPRISRAPLTSVAVPWVIVPRIVRLLNPLLAFSVRTAVAAPDKMTVLDPLMNAEPAPEVSQLPLTVQVPLVSRIVPDVPPFIVASASETADALAVSRPESPTVIEPPVNGKSAVASSVVEPAVS